MVFREDGSLLEEDFFIASAGYGRIAKDAQ